MRQKRINTAPSNQPEPHTTRRDVYADRITHRATRACLCAVEGRKRGLCASKQASKQANKADVP